MSTVPLPPNASSESVHPSWVHSFTSCCYWRCSLLSSAFVKPPQLRVHCNKPDLVQTEKEPPYKNAGKLHGTQEQNMSSGLNREVESSMDPPLLTPVSFYSWLVKISRERCRLQSTQSLPQGPSEKGIVWPLQLRRWGSRDIEIQLPPPWQVANTEFRSPALTPLVCAKLRCSYPTHITSKQIQCSNYEIKEE